MVEWRDTWRKVEEIWFIHPRDEKADPRDEKVHPNHGLQVAKRELQRTYRGSLLTRLQGDRTRGDRHKLLQGKFCLNTRKIFLIMRTIKHWIRLPKEEVESPSLEKFKTQLDRAPDNLGPAFIRGLEPEDVQSSLVI